MRLPIDASARPQVSKTALLGLTHALSRELAPLGIRVNCLAPGIVKTRFSQGLWENEELASSRVPMGRLATADEMGGTEPELNHRPRSLITCARRRHGRLSHLGGRVVRDGRDHCCGGRHAVTALKFLPLSFITPFRINTYIKRMDKATPCWHANGCRIGD